MPSISPYLTFNGNCREVFDFYSKVFGTEFVSAGTFKDMPPEYAVAEKYHHLIMHATIHVGDTLLFGSDTTEHYGPPAVPGTNFSLAVSLDSEEEARRVFEELSSDGHVKMPLSPSFWGSLFGVLKDKFDINWMISYELPKE